MKQYENLFICKSLNKRAYEYRGVPFHTSWKLKDSTTNKLYDSYEDYLKDTTPPKEEKVKPTVKKKATIKKIIK
ncbi:hypothetical protein DRQ25_18075 [Candidatus Fermentibacteria bacterium]|nr:MAG: hypothetical protein DRQ25_18075 [Candidatus Fermentibacteria bacterium]